MTMQPPNVGTTCLSSTTAPARCELGVITQRDDSVTIIGAPMLAATYRAVLLGIRQRSLDGLPSADLQRLARALFRAHTIAMSRPRRGLASHATGGPCSNGQDGADLISVGEAAALLRVSRRQVQRLAADPRGGLGGVRVGQTWALDRGAVLALASAREREAAK
jgi:excisionase family DNA binding protein